MATEEKGLPELGRELVDMTVAYAKQETIEPLKVLKGFVAKGVTGAAAVAVGLVFLLLGILRLLQTEGGEHLDGNWSVVPYAGTVVVAAVIALLFAIKIKSGGKP